MNPGIRYLLKKHPLGGVRKLRRQFSGVKGIALLIGITVALTALLVPQILAFAEHDGRIREGMISKIVAWGPLGLLGLSLTMSLTAGGLYFRPPEITYLFPAPIPRRDLLLYNVLSRASTQVLSALFLSIFFAKWGRLWYGAVLALVLAQLFLQMNAQMFGLLYATAGQRFARRVKLAIPVVVVGVAVLGLRSRFGESALTLDAVRHGLVELRDTQVVQFVCGITRPFVEVFIAPDLTHLVTWAPVAVGVLLLQLFALSRLDVAFVEGALATSQRLQKKLQRAGSGAGALGAAGPSKARFRLPNPPHFGGAGPIAWRQLTEVTRNPRPVLLIVVVVAFMVVPMSQLGALRGADDGSGPESAYRWLGLFAPIVVFTTAMTQQLTFDFRRDLDRMAFLKGLPLRRVGIAAGQLVANTTLLTSLQLIVLLVLVGIEIAQPLTALALVPVLVCVNWISVGLDNAFFLIWPYRLLAKDPGQFQFMGRVVVVMFSKMMTLMVTLGVALIPSIFVLKFTKDPNLGFVSALPLLVIVAVTVTILCAHFFDRFDVSKKVA